MPLRKLDGILVGRPGQGHLTFNWGVVPKNMVNPDLLECELPTELFPETLVINSKRARRLLKYFYIVEYYRRDVPSVSQGGLTSSLPLADIVGVKEKIPLEKILDEIKRIDPLAEKHDFTGEVEIDEKFILDLSNALGTGVKMPKRFYATQILLKIEDGDKVHTIMMPLAEVIAFLQDNPDYIKGLVVLPSYHFGFIITEDTISMDVFKDEVLDQITLSIQTFRNLKDSLRMTGGVGGEFEE